MTSKLPLPEFEDGKSADALRTIGEVAKAFNLRQHVLRYWEEQFPMLRPLTRAGGRRYYRPEDIALIAEISRLLYQEGFTIRGARQFLSAGNAKESGGFDINTQEADVALQARPASSEETLLSPDFGEKLNQSRPSENADGIRARQAAVLSQLTSLRAHLVRALEA